MELSRSTPIIPTVIHAQVLTGLCLGQAGTGESAWRGRAPALWYLSPGGQVPSFRADEIPVLPAVQKAGKAPNSLLSGAALWGRDQALRIHLVGQPGHYQRAEELEDFLYTFPLPVRISETRDYRRRGTAKTTRRKKRGAPTISKPRSRDCR